MKVKLDQKRVDDFHPAPIFLPGTLVESRQGNQYLTMVGDNGQTVLVSLVNNKVYGVNKIDGAGGSRSYRKIPFSQIVLEAD